MFMEAPQEVSTCRSKGPKGEVIERTHHYVIASRSLKGKVKSAKWRRWKIEAMKSEDTKEVVVGMMKKANAFEGTKSTPQRTYEQRVRQNWDCSQIEDSVDEDVMDWYEDDELRKQWEEVVKVEEKLRQKKAEEGELQCDALQKRDGACGFSAYHRRQKV